jgi:phage internal scaffolding protein
MSVNIEERPNGTRRVSMSFSESVDAERSRTKPEFHKDADINVIMKKYKRTGVLGDPSNAKRVIFGDFTNGNDFSEAMRKIATVQDVFSGLPASIRARFQNDPRQLMDFLKDPANDAEGVKLGLLKAAEKKNENPGGEKPAAPAA